MTNENLRNSLKFSLSSTRNFEDREFAAKIVEICLSLPSNIKPEKFDVFEPLKRTVASADEIVDVLINKRGPKSGLRAGSLLLGKGKEIGYSVQWDKSSRPTFSGISGWIGFEEIDRYAGTDENWLDAIRKFVLLLSPSYGEIKSMAVKGWFVPRNLQVRLPDVPQISIYGKEYIEFFGSEKIEHAPFTEVEKVGECYWLVAQKSIREAVPDDVRAKIRSYFGEDAFMANGRWKYKDGRAPKFDLSNSLS